MNVVAHVKLRLGERSPIKIVMMNSTRKQLNIQCNKAGTIVWLQSADKFEKENPGKGHNWFRRSGSSSFPFSAPASGYRQMSRQWVQEVVTLFEGSGRRGQPDWPWMNFGIPSSD
jgi:hypothetical protein